MTPSEVIVEPHGTWLALLAFMPVPSRGGDGAIVTLFFGSATHKQRHSPRLRPRAYVILAVM